MTRSHRHGAWRRALSAGAACGLAISSAVFAADTQVPGRDSADLAGTQTITADAELDAAFQSLGVATSKAGSSSSSVRKQAISDLQTADLSPDATAKVNKVLNN